MAENISNFVKKIISKFKKTTKPQTGQIQKESWLEASQANF